MQIVLASNNPGKLREFKALLEPLGCEILPQKALGITSADEPFETFVENALAKARHAARVSGLPAIADDSGICVDALGGAPGIHSARFAGDGATDADNNARLIEALQGQTQRSAHYVCVLVAVKNAQDPEPLIAHATWEGLVIDTPRGENGFGYDPYFFLEDFGLTAAQLPPETKNSVSHRAKAMRLLRELLAASWKL
ncbi:MAG TPA: non-canonical purine NTP pyrophosphatase, RdgB/HAM1 family [Sutterella sp.]|nr:non-canonical purine NTP pyrophosphatase, RdgB/HAM1 family [Sutterella sp.]